MATNQLLSAIKVRNHSNRTGLSEVSFDIFSLLKTKKTSLKIYYTLYSDNSKKDFSHSQNEHGEIR